MQDKDICTCEYCENEFNSDDMFWLGDGSLLFCEGCFQLVNPKTKTK